jgi:hypothetical protein
VEAGSNTSTVTLRVVGGDEKGSIKSETVKYDHEFYGTRTRKRLRRRGPAAIVNDRTVLLSERAPQINKPATVRQSGRNVRLRLRCDCWIIKFNERKTQAICFSRRLRVPDDVLQLNRRDFPFVNNVTYLGVTFDERPCART